MALPMRKLVLHTAVAAAVLLPAATGPAAAFDDAERKEIETIVRDYLLANPEVLLEVQQALTAKQMAEQRDQQQKAIASKSDSIFGDSRDPVLGNPEGNVTIVEFFDYNCGYCKRALTDMVSMMEGDSELRFVLKEFPILGPESEEAHRVAFAFHDLHPDRYTEFHLRLLGGEGRANEESAMRIALDLGADEAALRRQMEDDSVIERIRDTYQLATELGISGTPAYVIGDEVVSGALGEEVLATKVANVRECGSTVC
ncbi:DsbA family protein [Oricola thermophila]|uniref:DsbA family protein n=1 Tax=Oricola thermophila TaxID=2742145 RepID=A0A6N1VFJ7_9HYPH|nr:DsbA family protein [Oricola thermophila]QKV18012.1 DsbA family protein [Oricola thermophila]